MKSIILLIIVTVVPSWALSQSGQPEQRHDVTVKLKNGETKSGKFVFADNRKVELEIALVGLVSIKTDDVASIAFGESSGHISDKSADAAKAAVKALKSLGAATDVGINRLDYGRRLIEVKITVDEALDLLPDGWLKTKLGETLRYYRTAADDWDASIKWQVPSMMASVRSDWEMARKELAWAERFLGSGQK
jgi:hypothetical protein